jgi:hypothetical protein
VGAARLVLAAVIVSVAAAGDLRAADNDSITVNAVAGLGGIARAGRWAPVRVSIANRQDRIDGELVITWGASTVHREVVLPAPSRNEFELYVRTTDVRDTLDVRLRSEGRDVRTVAVPIRVVPADEDVTVCVSSDGVVDTSEASCTTVVTAEGLPRSMRGYEAADAVLWGAGADSSLGSEQRTAVKEWEFLRRLEADGTRVVAPHISFSTSPLADARRSLMPFVLGMVTYVALLVVVGWSGRRREGVAATYLAVALIGVVGTSIAVQAGRWGTGSTVLVRHATTLMGIPGAGTLVSMRGSLEYPAFDDFQVHSSAADAAFDRTGPSRSEQWFDLRGYPTVGGIFGLGAAQQFSLDGVVGDSWLHVERHPSGVTVTNTSPIDFHDCRFPEGFAPTRVDLLRSGESVNAAPSDGEDVPFLSCTSTSGPFRFNASRHQVQLEGEWLVTAYIPHDDNAGAASVP